MDKDEDSLFGDIFDNVDPGDLEPEELDPEDEEEPLAMTPESLGGSATTRSRDEALDGGLPLLMLHREYNHYPKLNLALNVLHQTSAASLSLSLVVTLPEQDEQQAKDELAAAQTASVLIADPASYARSDQWGPRLLIERDGNATPKPDAPAKRPLMRKGLAWRYFDQDLPQGPTDQWVSSVLDAQRSVGANLLLTPGLPLDAVHPSASLISLREQVMWARRTLQTDERLAVYVTADSPWLSDRKLRGRLLDEIVASDENDWYVRIQWPQLSATYAQLSDADVLDGYRALIDTCQEEQKVLLLPRTGGTGWLSLAWGATGFGTGIGSKARAFSHTRFTPTGGVPRTNRYFERELLHTVTKQTEDALARLPGFIACQCPFCTLLRVVPAWNTGWSGAHYVLQAGRMTAALASGRGRGRLAPARGIVNNAVEYQANVSAIVPLIASDQPTHLMLWQDRV